MGTSKHFIERAFESAMPRKLGDHTLTMLIPAPHDCAMEEMKGAAGVKVIRRRCKSFNNFWRKVGNGSHVHCTCKKGAQHRQITVEHPLQPFCAKPQELVERPLAVE